MCVKRVHLLHDNYVSYKENDSDIISSIPYSCTLPPLLAIQPECKPLLGLYVSLSRIFWSHPTLICSLSVLNEWWVSVVSSCVI